MADPHAVRGCERIAREERRASIAIDDRERLLFKMLALEGRELA
jgi:hypothetical protein